MQVVNKKMCVIVILVLVIIESCTLFLMYKSFSNKNTSLDEVNLNINNSNMFAIMLEQDDGTYKEDTSNTWPTSGYTYNETMSGCIDINGNKLDGVLSYDATNNIATVDTGNTSYCYLYFSKVNAGKYLLKNPSEGLVTTSLQGNLYRYQGIQGEVDNYICFGYSNYETDCDFSNTTNSDLYAYRIIGVNEDYQIKLIKKEALNNQIKWGSGTGLSTTDYPDSGIYNEINGNSFLNNNLYITEDWRNKIATSKWKYGYTTDNGNYDGQTMYAIENEFTDSVNAKIGLIYMHDYYFAYLGGKPENYTNAATSWIHIKNNDISETEIYDSTMIQYMTNTWLSWVILLDGQASQKGYNLLLTVRPVFYLETNLSIIQGTGTIVDPFIIK